MYTTENLYSQQVSVYTDLQKEGRARSAPNTKPLDDETDYDPPTIVKILRAQQQGTIFRTAASQVKQRDCKLAVSQEGLLFCKAHLDGAIQFVLPPSLQQRISMKSHFSSLAGHPSHYQMYDTRSQAFYWHHVAADVDFVVHNCSISAGNHSKFHQRCNILLFLASDPFEPIGMDFVESFPKVVQSSQ